MIKARAARLRQAGVRALSRRLEARTGTLARALVEAPGRGRDEDYLEIAFTGPASVGSLITGVIAGHDGARARLDAWAPL
jgi:threonylcarbamoyladenosine tRNA methylthiotransferase MtaB